MYDFYDFGDLKNTKETSGDYELCTNYQAIPSEECFTKCFQGRESAHWVFFLEETKPALPELVSAACADKLDTLVWSAPTVSGTSPQCNWNEKHGCNVAVLASSWQRLSADKRIQYLSPHEMKMRW